MRCWRVDSWFSMGGCWFSAVQCTWMPAVPPTWLPAVQCTWLPVMPPTWMPAVPRTWRAGTPGPGDDAEDEPAGPSGAGAGSEDEEEPEEEGEQESEPTDLQLAWEHLEAAKVIWGKHPDQHAVRLAGGFGRIRGSSQSGGAVDCAVARESMPCPPSPLPIPSRFPPAPMGRADVHTLLGDAALENEDFESALSDYQEAAECLDRAEAGAGPAGPSSALLRQRAEVLYKLGMAWQFQDNAGEALSAVQAAAGVLAGLETRLGAAAQVMGGRGREVDGVL